MNARKRVYGPKTGGATGRARSRSTKRRKMVALKVPRLKDLRNPHSKPLQVSMRTKINYSEFFTINPGIASTGSYVFSLNGLYDPNISGVGTQPIGFDQLMALYQEFVVLGCTIKLHARCLQASGQTPMLFGMFIERTTTTSNSWNDYVNNGDGVYSVADIADSGSCLKSLTYSANMHTITGVNVEDEENFAGNVASNPTEQRYLHVVCAPFDNVSDMGTQQFFIEINYDAIFRDRLITPPS